VAVEALPLEAITCPLCGGASARTLWVERDLALGVPGRFHAARCEGCGLLYQNPRVRVDHLAQAYPPNYPAHTRDPELSRILRDGSVAVRRVLAHELGYRHLDLSGGGRLDSWRALARRRKVLKNFPPWTGSGRLLDVGCASGRFIKQMAAVGWEVAGIEFDPEAAAKAKTVTERIFIGDPVDADFPPASFDLVTAFHVIEHLPDPLGSLRNMVRWLAPGGLMIVEVPNVAGVGGSLFGRYWSGLDFPRHLIHFTPASMGAMVGRAGGRVVHAWHKTKPRYLTRSLRHMMRERGGLFAHLVLGVIDNKIGGGAVKLALELTMPLFRVLRRGEAVRYFIRSAP
jgi:SAM-dependent methyltransferase